MGISLSYPFFFSPNISLQILNESNQVKFIFAGYQNYIFKLGVLISTLLIWSRIGYYNKLFNGHKLFLPLATFPSFILLSFCPLTGQKEGKFSPLILFAFRLHH